MAKLNASGSALIYSTYLGGSSSVITHDEEGRDIAVDSSGNAYVTGQTNSSFFPRKGAFDDTPDGNADAFVTKFDASGGLAYSTVLGGGSIDFGNAIAVDSAGSVYVTGLTNSADFPLAHPIDGTLGSGEDVFVTKFNAWLGARLPTFLGGSAGEIGNGIAADAAGNAYVTGATFSNNFPTAGRFNPPAATRLTLSSPRSAATNRRARR